MASDNEPLAQGMFILFDDLKYLDPKQNKKLEKVITFIARKKKEVGEPEQRYIIINEKAPYAHKVLGLILAEEERAAQLLSESVEEVQEDV